MDNIILLSINPEFVDKIFKKEKLFEYRKVSCKGNVKKIVIYETSPICRIVGEVDIKDILNKDKEILWKETSFASGINKDFYDAYFNNKDKAVAYSLDNPIEYPKKIELKELGIKAAPQSFIYLDMEKYNKIKGILGWI